MIIETGKNAFLERQNSIHVGQGDIEGDIQAGWGAPSPHLVLTPIEA